MPDLIDKKECDKIERKHEAPPRYDAAFKEGAIRLVTEEGRPMREVAENFFRCLKCELVYLTSYATRRQAQNSIFRYIEGFYNPVRPHSSIGWLSPMEYARQLKRQNVA